MVVRDLMDIMHPHADLTAEGTFFSTRPLNGNAGGVPFSFSYVEPRTRAYTRIFDNVSGDDEKIAIRTDERLDVKPRTSFIALPDGLLYIVTEVVIDRDKAPKQALRLFANPFGTELLIRLKRYEDVLREV